MKLAWLILALVSTGSAIGGETLQAISRADAVDIWVQNSPPVVREITDPAKANALVSAVLGRKEDWKYIPFAGPHPDKRLVFRRGTHVIDVVGIAKGEFGDYRQLVHEVNGTWEYRVIDDALEQFLLSGAAKPADEKGKQ